MIRQREYDIGPRRPPRVRSHSGSSQAGYPGTPLPSARTYTSLVPAAAYFRHKVGVKSTKMVKISNLPSNMAAEHTHVWKSLSTP